VSTINFNEEEKEIIFTIAEKITGTCQTGKYRRGILVSNVARRIMATRTTDLEQYLEVVWSNPEEMAEFISALTIHTTHWFRENNHYQRLEQILTREGFNLDGEKFRLLCAATSTGEEAYSFGLVLENMRRLVPGFEYEIVARDIDPVSIAKARKGVYKVNEDLKKIKENYRRFLLFGSGKTKGFFTIEKDIRQRIRFEIQSLTDPIDDKEQPFDWVVCRNVLIYFKPDDVEKIIRKLMTQVKPAGTLVLGSSESIEPKKYELASVGNSSYVRNEMPKEGKSSKNRVLVIDDSSTIRLRMAKILSPQFKVVSVGSADEATDYLKINKVDVITLDLNMPGKDGQTWLLEQRRAGMTTPVTIVSGASPSEVQSVLNALGDGAQDCIDKAELQGDTDQIINRLNALVDGHVNRRAINQKRRGPKANSKGFVVKPPYPDLILIGASTGGTETLCTMLKNFNANCPPVVVVQHIQPGFSKGFSERLAAVSGLTNGQSRDGVELLPHHLYMAHGDYHVGIRQKDGKFFLQVANNPPVNRHRPSVDFLFQSAQLVKGNIFAAILTGMGSDGAKGLLGLKQLGATTFAQDESSCVVFGMPKEAIKLGAAGFVGEPYEIRREMDKVLLDPDAKAKTKKAA
jgi:chemotaxis response regulator CheB/chemotaxis methyl-accepting protein methylase